jgi:hypothetical protein
VENVEDIGETSAKFEKVLELTLEESEGFSESESAGNSAATSWSDGSTEELSDEIEDEDQWNDWGNERLTIEELNIEAKELDLQAEGDEGDDEPSDVLASEGDVESDVSDDSDDDNFWASDAEEEEDIQISGVPSLRLRQTHKPAVDQSSVESNYSPSLYSLSRSEDDSDFDNEGGRLEDLISGNKNAKSSGEQSATIRIFDTTRSTHTPVFHFTQFVTGTLFSSNPAFHPSKPLCVWPLGDGEVLFANFEANTYFTRQLCCSGYRSCHVFVKAHFSANGEYLHFAALEARHAEMGPTDKSLPLVLCLQVSTHRLSVRKTARSPPRLLFRTTVPLGASASISVSSLPYTLTWTDKELFFTTRGETLDVMRIPLFRTSSDATTSRICYIQNRIFLPRSANSRSVHFFPLATAAVTGSGKTEDKDNKEDTLATVILGSYSNVPSQGRLVPKYQVSPPISAYVRDGADLGGWTCKVSSEMGKGERANNAGGRLQGKFETFNRNEDCDIVPYLF